MKKLVLAAVAASLVAVPAVAAPPPQHRSTTVVRHVPGHTVVKQRDVYRGGHQANAYRTWHRGERFDRRYARDYRPISNWQAYRSRHLYAPPRGYQWVRSGNDAVLVAVAIGLIGAVLAGALN